MYDVIAVMLVILWLALCAGGATAAIALWISLVDEITWLRVGLAILVSIIVLLIISVPLGLAITPADTHGSCKLEHYTYVKGVRYTVCDEYYPLPVAEQ